LHPTAIAVANEERLRLSIPVTWDFLLHHSEYDDDVEYPEEIFQFPLLGIFSCIPEELKEISKIDTEPFNSRYLGFSLASVR